MHWKLGRLADVSDPEQVRIGLQDTYIFSDMLLLGDISATSTCTSVYLCAEPYLMSLELYLLGMDSELVKIILKPDSDFQVVSYLTQLSCLLQIG